MPKTDNIVQSQNAIDSEDTVHVDAVNADAEKTLDLEKAETLSDDSTEITADAEVAVDNSLSNSNEQAEEDEPAESSEQTEEQTGEEPEEPELLYEDEIEYSRELFDEYVQLSDDPDTVRRYISSIIMGIVGIIAVAAKMYAGGIALIVVAVLNTLMKLSLKYIKRNRRFNESILWGHTAQIRLYEDYAELRSDTRKKRIPYDKFLDVYTGEHHMYVDGGPRDILIIDEEKASPDLLAAIRHLVTDSDD